MLTVRTSVGEVQHSSRHRLVAGLLCLLTVLAPAGPALAEDIYDIDATLEEAGFAEAYVDVVEADDGQRVTIDFDVSATADEKAYVDGARRAAEVVWDELEVQISTVDVQPTYAVTWLDGELPAAISFTRRDLEGAFGPRAEELDAAGDPYGGGSSTDVYLGDVAGAVVGAVVLLVLGGIGLAVVLLVRRDRRTRATTTGWGGPPGWGPPSAGAPVWGGPPAAASGWGGYPTPTGSPYAGPPPYAGLSPASPPYGGLSPASPPYAGPPPTGPAYPAPAPQTSEPVPAPAAPPLPPTFDPADPWRTPPPG
ncbi:MAG: hypothetical protein JWO60_561 [Frankiales bacterium]|nr:hypothetical protein [Frankiales bacterium]